MKYNKRLFIRIALLLVAIVYLSATYISVYQSCVDVLAQQGSRGTQVRQIQEKLKSKGFYNGKSDGIWGKETTSAIKSFQKSVGLTQDGVAGVVTLTGLGFTFKQGVEKGEEIKLIQRKLGELGYMSFGVDGVYGKTTSDAVSSFQTQNALTSDGEVGFTTAKKLFSSNAKHNSTQTGYSESDYHLLAKIISAEARGEPYIGQVAVGAVVLNRVEHPSFPDTLSGVVYQKGAFTAVTDGQINEKIAESCYRAAKEALNGSDPSGGSIYYYNPDKTNDKWIRTRSVIKRIGAHLFAV